MLLVRGDHSQLFTAADAERAAAELRRCRVEIVPGGHTPLWDSLAETGALVKSFVATPAKAQRTTA